MSVIDYLGLWLVLPLGFIFFRFGKSIHKHEYTLYLIVFFLSMGLSALTFTALPIRTWFLVYDIFYSGHLSFALFTLVMAGGVFKKKTKPKIYLLRVRRELAILGFISLFPHAFLRWSLALNGFNFTGLIAFLIMVPLIVTSFPIIRKKMHPKTWNKIHYAAYIIYAMIYIHLALNIYISSQISLISVKSTGWPYIILFAIYILIKLFRLIEKSRPLKTKVQS